MSQAYNIKKQNNSVGFDPKLNNLASSLGKSQ
jgi:hypothetical protein